MFDLLLETPKIVLQSHNSGAQLSRPASVQKFPLHPAEPRNKVLRLSRLCGRGDRTSDFWGRSSAFSLLESLVKVVINGQSKGGPRLGSLHSVSCDSKTKSSVRSITLWKGRIFVDSRKPGNWSKPKLVHIVGESELLALESYPRELQNLQHWVFSL